MVNKLIIKTVADNQPDGIPLALENEIPLATEADQENDWTLGYDFLVELQKKVQKFDEASLEAIETTVLALFGLEPKHVEPD